MTFEKKICELQSDLFCFQFKWEEQVNKKEEENISIKTGS